MELLGKIRKQENLHIVFWLVKDSCWMLEIKWLGAIMVVPALFVALRISYMSRLSNELYLNLAVFFWITANSFWMLVEFFYDNQFKNLSGIPFGLGFIFVGIYFYRSRSKLVKSA